MLLYDRIRERIHRCDHADPAWRDHLSLVAKDYLNWFNVAQVFELTDLFQLFGDWNREKHHKIPKRSPYQFTWCEWKCSMRTDFAFIPMTVGALISSYPASPDLDRWAQENCPSFVPGNDLMHFQTVRYIPSFRFPEGDQFPSVWGVDYWRTLGSISPEGIVKSFFLLDLDKGAIHENKFFSAFGMAPLFDFNRELLSEQEPSHFPWPPLMAFSLLHCKNVEMETHNYTPTERRRVERGGNPPRAVYKMLKIKLPQVVASHRAASDPSEEDERKMRFHLCRGHFKNLQHDRYKVKGLHWWPAHWRGSQESGRVEKTYSLIARGTT